MVELEFFIILGGIHHISHIRLQERDGLESFRHEGGGFETSIGRAHSAGKQGILEETTLQLHLESHHNAGMLDGFILKKSHRKSQSKMDDDNG